MDEEDIYTFARYDSELFIDYNALVCLGKLLGFVTGSGILRKVSFVVSTFESHGSLTPYPNV